MKSIRLLLAAMLLPAILFSATYAQPPAAAPGVHKFKRGLIPLTKEQKAKRATGLWHKTGTYPAQWSIVSPKNSMFLNDTYGDCVLAGEAVNINAHWYFVTGQPLIISDAAISTYGNKHDLMNGADLMQVIGLMSITHSDGLTYSSGTLNSMYCDGVGEAVNYQNRANLCSACFSCSGSLKMGVDAQPLEDAGAGNANGWYVGSYNGSGNIDHNVEMLGYGPASYCFQVLATPLPAGVDPKQFCYLVNTWSTIGVVAAPVIEASGFCNEIDSRTPTSIALTNVKPPKPPRPTPTGELGSLLKEVQPLIAKYQTGTAYEQAQVLSLMNRVKKDVSDTKKKLGLAQ